LHLGHSTGKTGSHTASDCTSCSVTCACEGQLSPTWLAQLQFQQVRCFTCFTCLHVPSTIDRHLTTKDNRTR
jgi:hypothetical protein